MLGKLFREIHFSKCLEDILLALTFFTRIPIHFTVKYHRTLMQACWCFPLIGAGIGLVGGTFLYLLLVIQIPVAISAVITICFIMVLTGALHEDGLADTVDGLGGGEDKKSKIEKMRDSRIGSYGVLAILLLTLIKLNAIISLATGKPYEIAILSIICAHSLSRFSIIIIPYFSIPASNEGLARYAGKPAARGIIGSFLLTSILILILLPFDQAILSAVLAILVAGAVGLLANFQIKGYTGDILGAAQQVSEVTVLVYLASSSS
tara:strand:+ start:160 stop:951 length:792 start_codon:yes stop_codon:yes gene_type:complete